MEASVLTATRTLVLQEREIPHAQAGEMILKVRSAAICGTDVRMWNGAVERPLVLGHEVAGDIHELGEGVKGYSVGQKVSVAPNYGCGICDFCVSGKTHLCPDYRALGINMDGGFEEYVRIPADLVRQGNVCPLGPAISYAEAAAVEPLSCAFNGFEAYGVHPGDAVLTIGSGPIGCMHAMLAQMAGASLVIMNDLSAERLDYCGKTIGGIITYCGDDLKGFVMEKTRGRGADVCVTACPSPAAQAACFDYMAMFGRVCFFGGLPKGREKVELNTNAIHYKHLMVTGTSRSSLSQYRKCLQLVESGVLPMNKLITNHFSLEQIGEAFEFVSKAGGLKSVIDF